MSTSTDKPQVNKKRTNRANSSKIGSTSAGRRMLFLLLGLAICAILFLVALYPMVMVGAPCDATIKIPRNATYESVNDSLTKYFGESYAKKVINLCHLRNKEFCERHGAYEIRKGTNALGAMRRLTSGAQTPVRITINGFRSLPLLIERVSRKMEFPKDSLAAALFDTTLLAEYGLTPENAMALFLDDTYEVYWSASPRELISKIGDNYKYVWGATNTRRAKELGLTPTEVVILSSIVDEETNDKNEKGIIGRLYINRLNNNMKLQADPTVRYAVGDFTIQRVTKADLKTESPYNTYLHHGVPPGPIRTTSAATIRAVLESEPNNYLYMCAKEDFSGSHNFSASYDEHLRNAGQYQAALDREGIKR